MLAGTGIGAGMLQARKTPVEPATKLEVKTSSQTEAIPPPTYNNSAAGAETPSAQTEVQGAATTTPATPTKTSGATIIPANPSVEEAPQEPTTPENQSNEEDEEESSPSEQP